jgi:hypothetical protein
MQGDKETVLTGINHDHINAQHMTATDRCTCTKLRLAVHILAWLNKAPKAINMAVNNMTSTANDSWRPCKTVSKT